MHIRKHKSIPVEPVLVLWVEGHELVPEDVSDRRHTHGHTGVAGVGFEGGIDLQSAHMSARVHLPRLAMLPEALDSMGNATYGQ